VETATVVAARVFVEQTLDLRNALRVLGVPVKEKSYMFGDSKSVVDSYMQINAKLHKHHTILSFHCVLKCSLLCGDDTLPHRSTRYIINLLLLYQSPILIDLVHPFRCIFLPSLSGYSYGLTASVYVHLYLRGDRCGCLSRMYMLQLAMLDAFTTTISREIMQASND
jgi:hypothetical protein